MVSEKCTLCKVMYWRLRSLTASICHPYYESHNIQPFTAHCSIATALATALKNKFFSRTNVAINSDYLPTLYLQVGLYNAYALRFLWGRNLFKKIRWILLSHQTAKLLTAHRVLTGIHTGRLVSPDSSATSPTMLCDELPSQCCVGWRFQSVGRDRGGQVRVYAWGWKQKFCVLTTSISMMDKP